ncbi:MAG: hypothetical protein HQK49_15435 [Oligoflexia bacterium]|nr:hypothetical protein [Oligoflexia bacterium]
MDFEIIKKFDSFLSKKNESFEGIVIGGMALIIQGVVSRQTRDCDILSPTITENIKTLSKEFASTVKGLDVDWLNNGPESLSKDLPKGWELRCENIYSGTSLKLQTLCRSDLLKSKLFAYCDRGIDFEDCIKLSPTKNEIVESLDWLYERDGNTDWPEHVKLSMDKLAKELGYEL